MVLFRVAGGKLGRIFSFGLLLLVAAGVSRVSGQGGVSLSLRGETVPNGSFVDYDDIMYTAPDECCNDLPSNRNTRDEALKCITDLVDCCGTESPGMMRPERGNWYFPDGSRVVDSNNGVRFRVNRGPNELLSNGTQVNGSVRLYRRYNPTQRGRFRCELPNAANPSVDQTLYVNIITFRRVFTDAPVPMSASAGSTTAGRTGYSLTCSVTIFSPVPRPDNVPSPDFQWFFNGSPSLPSGVTAMPTTKDSTSEIYTGMLQFSPLSQFHAGSYTCRVGAVSLMNNTMVTVGAPQISAMVTANRNTPLMVNGDNTLTCDVSGDDNLSSTITYQWTRSDATSQTLVGTNSRTLSLSSVGLSDAGNYACHATVSSGLLINDITMSSGNQTVIVQVPAPSSVAVTTSTDSNIIRNGSTITVNCVVDFQQLMTEPELSLLMVDAQLFRDGTPLTLTGPTTTGTRFTFGAEVISFNDSYVGNYNCSATVQSSSQFIIGMEQETSPLIRLTIVGPSMATPSSNSDSSVAIIGGVVAVVLIIAIAATVIVIALILRNRRAEYKPDQRTPVAYEQPEIMLSKLPPTRDIYEAVEADHEYEIPDKYNQPQYDDVKIPPPKPERVEAESVQLQPLPSTGDYEFTQCPAYVPVVTTTSSIHGSGDKLESVYI